jgi:hypothetical protein
MTVGEVVVHAIMGDITPVVTDIILVIILSFSRLFQKKMLPFYDSCGGIVVVVFLHNIQNIDNYLNSLKGTNIKHGVLA